MLEINAQPASFPQYLSSFSPCKKFQRVAWVLSTTAAGAGGGAALGAGIGSCVAGVGAGPGAGGGAIIGGVGGLGFGIMTSAAWDYSHYKNWLRHENGINIIERVVEAAHVPPQDIECAITHTVPLDPVRTPHTKHFYERKNLEEWVEKHGTCPMSRKPMTRADIRSDLGPVALLNNSCKTILSEEGKNTFDAKELEGVKRLQKDYNNKVQEFVEKEQKDLFKKFQKGEISLQDYTRRMQEMADVIEPKKN